MNDTLGVCHEMDHYGENERGERIDRIPNKILWQSLLEIYFSLFSLKMIVNLYSSGDNCNHGWILMMC